MSSLIGRRPLSEEELLEFEILAKQFLNNRPAVIHCGLVRKFVRLWNAYELKCDQLKQAEERR